MLDRFLEFIKKHALIDDGDKLLLAISGGVDSMVLLNLISQTKSAFAVAHCNFQLRGEQADLDESLVKEVCEKADVQFHSVKFNTKEFASAHGISTQMAARQLRFDWFDLLCEEYGYAKIVLAHHRDDSIETFFLNLSRGTSLRGLRGIQPRNENLIRPLLSFSKDEIINFAKAQGVVWREDESNQETYYKRNLIRKELLPIFRQLNPDFEKVMAENLEKLSSRYNTSEMHYEDLRRRMVEAKQGRNRISIDSVKEHCHSAYDLYELLREFSFNHDTAEQLFYSLNQVGGVFNSPEFELLVDRDFLFIQSKAETISQVFKVSEGQSGFEIDSNSYEVSIINKSYWKLDTNIENAAFDYGLLEYPLEVRTWQEGDSFQPLGMKGKKLISDLLIDLKVPLIDKPNVRVMCTSGEIAWVIGYRISEKFKVSDKTQRVWVAKLQK